MKRFSVFFKSVSAVAIVVTVCALPFTASAAEKGNLNGNGCIWLGDAIIGLQVMDGLPSTGLVSPYSGSGADVNGDNKVGHEEVLYILQKVAGLRFAVNSYPSFVCGAAIPIKYAYAECNGQNISPRLSWTNAPASTQSFVLIIDDLDADGFVHWIVYDIPVTATSLAENAGVINSATLPQGAKQGMNSWASNSYGGPCPPSGIHRYSFTLYALSKASLNLEPADVDKGVIDNAIQGSVLDTAIVMGTYGTAR